MEYAVKKTIVLMLSLIMGGLTAPAAALAAAESSWPMRQAEGAPIMEAPLALDPAMTTESVAALTATASVSAGVSQPQHATASSPVLALVVLIVVLLLEATGITAFVKRRPRETHGGANGAGLLGMRTA